MLPNHLRFGSIRAGYLACFHISSLFICYNLYLSGFSLYKFNLYIVYFDLKNLCFAFNYFSGSFLSGLVDAPLFDPFCDDLNFEFIYFLKYYSLLRLTIQ